MRWLFALRNSVFVYTMFCLPLMVSLSYLQTTTQRVSFDTLFSLSHSLSLTHCSGVQESTRSIHKRIHYDE